MLIVAIVFWLFASGFYSGTEMGLYCANRVRVRLEADQLPHGRARMLQRLVKQPQESVLGILLGTNLSNYLLTVCTAALITRVLHVRGSSTDFYVAAILSPLVFVFGDVVPKNWFQADANRLMNLSAPALRASVLFFKYTGILWLLHTLTRLLVKLTGYGNEERWSGARAEVAGLLREGGAYGALTTEQTQIIERVMNLSEVRVGAIMVPLERVTALSTDATYDEFMTVLASHKYSRLPVVDRTGKQIAGVINVHHLLADEAGFSIERHLRKPLTITANSSAATALVHLRQARRTMAVVTDSRRGYVGIVTLKDVVEEIVGELSAW